MFTCRHFWGLTANAILSPAFLSTQKEVLSLGTLHDPYGIRTHFRYFAMLRDYDISLRGLAF